MDFIAKLVEMIAQAGAGQASVGPCYQPTVPEKLK